MVGCSEATLSMAASVHLSVSVFVVEFQGEEVDGEKERDGSILSRVTAVRATAVR